MARSQKEIRAEIYNLLKNQGWQENKKNHDELKPLLQELADIQMPENKTIMEQLKNRNSNLTEQIERLMTRLESKLAKTKPKQELKTPEGRFNMPNFR